MVEWREIDGCPAYEVSDEGRVRSYWTREGCSPTGYRAQETPRRVMKSSYSSSGYADVNLYNGAGTAKRYRVSALVMAAFVGPRPHGMLVCHNNNLRHDDRLENLRYDTNAGNMADKSEGARRAGARKLTDQQVIDIRVKHCVDGVPGRQLAREYGLSSTTPVGVYSGKTYAHLPGPRTTTKYVPSAALKQYTARTWV